MQINKALFLDRDGVINHNLGYVYKKDDFKFIDGIFELVKAAKIKKYLVIVVTNQAGIGRGFYNENDFFVLMEWVKIKFKHNDSSIDDIFFCPFHPTHGLGSYKKDSHLRKPNPGMIIEAQKKHNLNLSKSIMIGDNISDMEASKSSGIGTSILFSEGKSFKDAFGIENLRQALDYL
ncbi:HAD family hydrolase [Gammaproteobacteria bacterium]|nr:HAD family hydrolase [Gammaproteobacteria bacterium]